MRLNPLSSRNARTLEHETNDAPKSRKRTFYKNIVLSKFKKEESRFPSTSLEKALFLSGRLTSLKHGLEFFISWGYEINTT